MPNSNATTTTTNPAQGVPNSNGINSNAQQIPINHQYASTAGTDIPQGYHSQQGYGSPSGGAGGRQQQQFSPHFQQGFGFDPDIDDMFGDSDLRSHIDRMRSPFGTFGSRKRSGNKNPLHSVSSSYYDDADADFPQFGSLGRRRAGGGAGGIPTATDGIQRDDFFERLPPEFRQFIPDSFTLRRGGSGSGATANAATTAAGPESPRIHTQQPQYYQTYVQPGTPPPQTTGAFKAPPAQVRTVCDAAIQTEDPSHGNSQSEVDGNVGVDNLHQHGLRNTVDMGVKAPSEGEGLNPRAQSAPPHQQDQNNTHEVPVQQQQPIFHSQGTGTRRTTPPPAQQQRQFPPNQQPPQFQKVYYPPQNQSQQQPSTPQTPGGSYIRTIPIFVEGRSEPLINNRDIPQSTEAPPTQVYAQAKTSQAYPPQSQPQQQHPQQQQHNPNRPSPINTQQQPTTQQEQGPPPATPHTMDSINKIQDIQRDVLNLMSQVEKFAGARRDKEYAYLDEMLTRNLLKLDTIDTQGKESIRLARKEAIKCIQASINVLEAKAEENAKTAQPQEAVIDDVESNQVGEQTNEEDQPIDVAKAHEPIPLPPPESLKTGGSSENVPATKANVKEASPPKDSSSAATTTTNVTKSSSGSSAKGESVAEVKSE